MMGQNSSTEPEGRLALLKILDAVTDACVKLSALCVGVITVGYTAEVVARYAFNAPLNWSHDLGSYLLCASVFLALPKVTAEGAHPSISFVVDRLHGAVHGRYVRLLLWATTIAVVVVCFFTFEAALTLHQRGTLTPMANQIPRWWLAALASFGLFLTILNLVFRPRLAPEPTVPEI
jgi:TRAP-type C4-dicarboxylate transport system permease small subunit